MPSTVPFTTDASILPFTADLYIYTNDANQVVVVMTGLGDSDVVVQGVFTAKVNPTDADNAPTTVQKVATPANGLCTQLGRGTYQFVFPLTAADENTLLTKHTYSVVAFVNLAGQTPSAQRTLQTGSIQTAQGVSSLGAPLPAVATVVITPASASIYEGDQQPLVATPKDVNGNAIVGDPVSWQSSNTAIATVDSTGNVTAVAVGSCQITATVEGVSAVAIVTVAIPTYSA